MLKENVINVVYGILDDYLNNEYEKGNNEYIIVDIAELTKEEFNESIDNNFVNEVYKELINSFYKMWIDEIEIINSELKIILK